MCILWEALQTKIIILLQVPSFYPLMTHELPIFLKIEILHYDELIGGFLQKNNDQKIFGDIFERYF